MPSGIVIGGIVVGGIVLLGAVYMLCKKKGGKSAGVRVGRLTDLPRGKMREVAVPGTTPPQKVLLVHTSSGEVRALGTKCSHFKASMVNGVLADDRVVCPWHGACFNVHTGDIEDGPVVDGLPTYECEVRSGDVYVTVPAGAKTTGKRTQRMCTRNPADDRHFVIIGGGPAGLTAAEALRQEGFAGRITMLSKEEVLPYDRTKLSKSMSVTAQEAWLRPPEFFEDNNIEYQLGCNVTSVDTVTKTVRSSTGNYQYTKLLVATGGPARSFKPPERFVIPGAEARNIFVLRDSTDAEGVVRAIESFGNRARVLIVGSSFIGMEAAAFLVKSGNCESVTVVGMEDEPFARVLGPEVGRVMREIHTKNGVEIRMNETVEEFTTRAGGVSGVRLRSGASLEADIVIIGAGIIPATEFLADADGIEMERDGSVLVDEFLQARPDVFAAGDIARFPFHHATHPSSARIRVEHWDVAMDQGRAAARNMLGKDEPYRKIPFFWTAQYGKSLRYAGNAMQWDSIIVHGNMDAAEKSSFVVYYMNNDLVSAVATFNKDPQAVAALELFRLKAMPGRAQLEASASVDLVGLLESAC